MRGGTLGEQIFIADENQLGNGRMVAQQCAQVWPNAGVAAGDEIDLDLELDPEPRVVTVPADLAAALTTDPAARAEFDRPSCCNRLRHVLSIDGARTDQTRQRRVAKASDELRAGANPTMTDAKKPEAG